MSSTDTSAAGALPTIDCADEPIRIPGSIQPHGVLLAVDPSTLAIRVASANVAEHLGTTAEELLGRDVRDVVGPETVPALPLSDDALEPRRVTLAVPEGRTQTYDVLVHLADELLVLELELVRDTQADRPRRARVALRSLQGARDQAELAEIVAREVRAVTGFDRVMVYRFDADWNGEVVAEEAREDLDPYLGLHFPASDIPAQARELYTHQWLRSIPDATYSPSPLLPTDAPTTGRPLDLSGSTLRSVSPVHLEYLANMGVRASMSVSLIVHGRLWGLVACHQVDGPHYPGVAARSSAEFLGRTASLLLQGKEDEARYVDSLTIAATAAELQRELTAQARTPLLALTAEDRVLDLVEGATGAAVRLDGQLRLLGETPDAKQVTALAEQLWAEGGGTVATHRLGHDLPGSDLPAQLAGTAAGVLAVRVAAGASRDALMWFRPEVLREVHWAGDPEAKGTEATPDGVRLTPRHSFAAWVEQVRGTSEPWTASQVAAVEQLALDLGDLLMRRKAEEERVASALRRIVLTERPPTPEGYTLAQRFLPSNHDALGGDWYDVTALPDGRVVFMVGDVAGHGIAVAAITAQIRHALRAYLIDEGSAAKALRRAGALVATLLPGELATVIAVELEPSTGRVRVSRAGHMPVLHLTADAEAFVQGTRGPVMGVEVLGDAAFQEAELQLGRGECLALFTDGLVEERGTRVLASLDGLLTRAQGVERDPEELCDALLASAPQGDDDVTVVVLRRD
ncbi:SpoIIE family protein phosphatase [Actinotalea sp. C106]|uniref:SpoIIE family protein phosphatase n=1 Tax=Actinotalea sp. C106 TaxID=2908644 RepID=UPI0020293A24|nr:SpoIIE family protein phosphatase [Actinotalea sp. C106]